MSILWFLIVSLMSFQSMALIKDEKKCLDIPEVSPKKYLIVKDQSLPIILETSNRITHQLATHAFHILVKEVLGYAETEISLQEDDFRIESVIQRLFRYVGEKVGPPRTTINLEVWVRPDYDIPPLVSDCGNVAPPGRFGWFIPIKLNAPILDYYKDHVWNDHIREIHWSYFTDDKRAARFDIDEDHLDKLIESNGYNRINGTGSNYVCQDSNICTKSMYTPSQCERKSCAILLAPHPEPNKFLIDQIVDMGLLVKVLWLGDNVKRVAKELHNIYENKTPTNKSLLIFGWYPSDIVIDENDFISVTFKNSELYNFTSNEQISYKYEVHRLVKLASNNEIQNNQKNAQLLYDSLRSFKFEEKDYKFLLKMHEDNASFTLRETACRWMRDNVDKWRHWNTFPESVLYIGGIFPVDASPYNGSGIARAALLATSAINRNATILPGYWLRMFVSNGKCKADKVMKSFMDFMAEGHFSQLVGVLGPACSKTIDPLVGVSKHYIVMVISYGGAQGDRMEYPHFFSTMGEVKRYVHVYAKLFRHFGWGRVAVLAEYAGKCVEDMSFMRDELERNGIDFIANKEWEIDYIKRDLVDLKNKRARIIIADVAEDTARAVMCEAYKLNMTALEDYVWFLPARLSKAWYDTDYFNINKTGKLNCTTEDMTRAITGYFTMSHAFFAPDDAVMQENRTVGEWRKQYDKLPFRSDYAGFAYDAVWTYALALDKLAKTDPKALADLRSNNTMNKLVSIVRETDFYGISGRIKFPRNSAVSLMQWYDNAMHPIGNFYPNLSDKSEIVGGDLRINQSEIKWFTLDGNIPKDGSLYNTK